MTGGRKTAPVPEGSESNAERGGPFEYADYELSFREMLAEHVAHFAGCRDVLDLACGAGIFLELLAERGIPAVGVERNERVAEWVRTRGWNVVCQDAFDFLQERSDDYDGIFCSHFIEHLPFEQVLRLLELMSGRLRPTGTLVLVFPNPESVRMQLFGFWRDPEHVRFYHPELIEAVCRHYGLTVVHTNRAEEPFAIPPMPRPPVAEDRADVVSDGPETRGVLPARRSFRDVIRGPYVRLLRALRLVSKGELIALEQRMGSEREALREAFVQWSDHATWAMNRMWAWPDNAVIVCRKEDR
jgi:O-antigen chain-terminating methyltransferase